MAGYTCTACRHEGIPQDKMGFTFQSSGVLCKRHLTTAQWTPEPPIIKVREPRLSQR